MRKNVCLCSLQMQFISNNFEKYLLVCSAYAEPTDTKNKSIQLIKMCHPASAQLKQWSTELKLICTEIPKDYKTPKTCVLIHPC